MGKFSEKSGGSIFYIEPTGGFLYKYYMDNFLSIYNYNDYLENSNILDKRNIIKTIYWRTDKYVFNKPIKINFKTYGNKFVEVSWNGPCTAYTKDVESLDGWRKYDDVLQGVHGFISYDYTTGLPGDEGCKFSPFKIEFKTLQKLRLKDLC